MPTKGAWTMGSGLPPALTVTAARRAAICTGLPTTGVPTIALADLAATTRERIAGRAPRPRPRVFMVMAVCILTTLKTVLREKDALVGVR